MTVLAQFVFINKWLQFNWPLNIVSEFPGPESLKLKWLKAGFNVVLISSRQPQHTNVCFWYFPPRLRGLPDGEERRERLHKVESHWPASNWFMLCVFISGDSQSHVSGVSSRLFPETGGPEDQGDDDGVWDHDGGLPAARWQSQLLPHGHLQPRCDQVRHRLPDRGDWATGEWLVGKWSLASVLFCLMKSLAFLLTVHLWQSTT